jgi:enoyl-CoA hydratase/carnithine racemase
VRAEFRAAGPDFSFGGDLHEFGSAPDPATAHVIRLTRSVGALIASHRDRVTAYVHGACYGAGCEVPAFAGRVVATADARFALPEISLGLIPGAGGTVSVTGRIGRWRTAWLALSGARIDAPTALAWGLVDELSP